LRQLHEVGYLHSDVKPNNVVLDAFCDWTDLITVVSQQSTVIVNESARVHLVDFGLSESFITEAPDGGWQHIRCKKINRTLGNKFFMSLSQLKKYGKATLYPITYLFVASSRRNYLEQLLYTLVFLAKGDLPWSLKRSHQTIS
jgi:serine/threonine protein kinase